MAPKDNEAVAPKERKWIEIQGERYDITSFQHVHPGGLVINFYDNTDATDAFLNFHNPALLSKYQHLKVPKSEYTPLPVDPLIRDYREMRTRIEQRGLFKSTRSFFVGQAAIAIGLFCASFATFWHGWYWTSALLMGASQTAFGWLTHDFGHRAVTTKLKGDAWWNVVMMQFFQGGSSTWWTSKHNRHHLLPNVLKHDPDIHTDPLFVWSKMMRGGWWNKLQAVYFPILGPPVGVLFMNALVIRFSIRHREWKTLASILTYITLYCVFFGPLHYFIMRVVQGLWFQWVVAVNHFGELVFDFSSAQKLDWVRLVAATTVNVRGGWFLNWFTGHLNWQVEHHLFPRMPRCNYPLVAAEVEALFKKHNVPYGSYSPWVATKRLFEALAYMGRDNVPPTADEAPRPVTQSAKPKTAKAA